LDGRRGGNSGRAGSPEPMARSWSCPIIAPRGAVPNA
jgi:hypothetical protein